MRMLETYYFPQISLVLHLTDYHYENVEMNLLTETRNRGS